MSPIRRPEWNVREFLQGILATGLANSTAAAQQSAAGAISSASGEAASKLPRATAPGELRGEMLYRQLGSTGVTVSAIGLGGSHIAQAKVTETETARLLHEAIDRGISVMDNPWDYNEGRSERRMGNVLAQDGYRNKVFLMTKIDGRTKEAAAAQINESLTRLKTDHIDLLQFHEVLRFDDPQLAALLAKTEQVAATGKYELFKTSAHFDTARHPDWLGSDSPAVQKLAPQLPG